jgi:antitoxin HicB
MRDKPKGRIGSTFDAFLKEEGLYEEVTARAIKRVLVRQLNTLMHEQDLTKSALARRMQTSRAQLDRLLDPENDAVTLGTLTRAARAVGRQLKLELV